MSPLEIEALVPASALSVEPIELRASDGLAFRAWLYTPDALGASIVMLHGWRGSRSTMQRRAEAVAGLGHAVMVPSLRSHGDTSGERYDFGLDAWREVAACVEVLTHRRPDRPVVVIGFSYGAAVAVEAARRDAGRTIDGLVLDSIFASLDDALRNRCAVYLPTPLSTSIAWSVSQAVALWDPALVQVSPANSCGALAESLKVLLVRGERDTRVSADESRVIANALGARSTTLIVDSAKHDRCFERQPEQWMGALQSFVAPLTPR